MDKHRKILFAITLTISLILTGCSSEQQIDWARLNIDWSQINWQSLGMQQPDFLRSPNALTTPQASAQTPTPTPQVALELEPVPEIEWFTPTDFMRTHWEVIKESGLPARVTLKPREESDQTKKLLFLYTASSPVYDNAVNQMLSVFQNKHIPIAASAILFVDDEGGFKSLEIAEKEDFDLIFTLGSATASFLHENYQGGSLPVVTALAKDPVLLGQMPDYESGSGTNIAYTSVSVPVELQMSYLQTLMPEMEYIVILYESENVSTVTAQVEPVEQFVADEGIELIHVPVKDPENAQQELRSKLPTALKSIKSGTQSESIIVLVTNSRSIFAEFETVNELSRGYPVVGLTPDLVQEGDVSALLSIGVSFDSNAILASLYGVRILNQGVDPGTLPVGVVQPPDIAINFLKAREIGLQIPFSFFESATIVYGPDGSLARNMGQ